MREIIGAYHRCCAELIAKAGGFRRQVHGRRRARLFRLSAGPRGRRRARGARRAGIDRGGGEARCRPGDAHCKCASALPPAWWWSAISSARARRRSTRWSARPRTWRRGFRRWPSRTPSSSIEQHPPLARRSLRVSRSRQRVASRASPSRCRPGEVVGASAVESRFEALRSGQNAAGRPRRGDRAAAAPLGAGKGRRRLRRADLGRARHRQVAHRRDHRWNG